jgi:hypothetical protein
MAIVLVDARGDGGEPLLFTGVKAGAKDSTVLSLSMYGFWVLITGKCKTADIVCSAL